MLQIVVGAYLKDSSNRHTVKTLGSLVCVSSPFAN